MTKENTILEHLQNQDLLCREYENVDDLIKDIKRRHAERFSEPNDKSPIYHCSDPTEADLETEEFNKVWECIKTWDINVPEAYEGYCGATGNHVIAILIALGMRDITEYS